MTRIEDPMALILRDFCHVEWYEIHELAELVQKGDTKFDSEMLRLQFERLIAGPLGIAQPINELTANEFESDEDAREWLLRIYQQVF